MCFRPPEVGMKKCPQCGADNKPIAKTCESCGAALDGSAASAPGAPQPPAAPGAPAAPKPHVR